MTMSLLYMNASAVDVSPKAIEDSIACEGLFPVMKGLLSWFNEASNARVSVTFKRTLFDGSDG